MAEDGSNKIVYYAKTSDGWKLAIKRYQPIGRKSKYPVVLCHGFAANSYSVDFGLEDTDEWHRYSLAAYLSKGKNRKLKFDVWVPELRGRNGSKTFDTDKYPEKYNWFLDDYVDKDVPAIVSCIKREYRKEKNRASKVLWVGKSMGGMLAYAYGQTHAGRRNLKGVVTLGSPSKFDYSSPGFKFFSPLLPRNILSGPLNLSKQLKKVNGTAFYDIIIENFANKHNMKKRILDEYLKTGFNNDVSVNVFKQFAIFLRHGIFCRYPAYPWLFDLSKKIKFLKKRFSPYSYTENFHNFKTPLYVIAGGKDKIAHPDDVIEAIKHVGSRWVNGEIIPEYGHLDLNLGKNAKWDVYPVVQRELIKISRLS